MGGGFIGTASVAFVCCITTVSFIFSLQRSDFDLFVV